jgi:hypothetical protein
MKTVLNKIKKYVARWKGRRPSPLPVGMTEFNAWVDSIVNTYDDLPTKDIDSIKFTLSSIIMHLGPQEAYKPKSYFVLTMKAAAAKQVAGAYFYEIKEKQKQAALKQAEATASQQVASNGQQK